MGIDAIPTIDIGPLLAADDLATGPAERSIGEQLVSAAEETGFFALTGHGIDGELLDQMRTMTIDLFDVDDEAKERQTITRDNYRGFIPLGFFTPNRDDLEAPAPDRYEGFKLHWEVGSDHSICAESAIYGPNRWADQPENMADVVLEYWSACDKLAAALLGVFEMSLGVPAGDLARRFEHPVTNMTLLHYPPSTPDEDVHGIHPHKDTNVFTILYPDPVGGLFVRTRTGEWIEAEPAPDALLVNTGDMMEVWSGGRFVSTPHKVVNTTGQQRYAFPWFLVPSHDEVIEPLVELQPGFVRTAPLEVGPWSLEVWRTNWADAEPVDDTSHLGTLDQP